MHSFPFRHPSIVMRISDFKAIGWYDQTSAFIFDILTEAKLLCRGNMVYDPFIGSIDRVNEGNASRSISRVHKQEYRSHRYTWIIAILEKNGVDWQSILEKQIDDMSLSATFRLLRQFLQKKCVAPAFICRLTWEKVKNKNTRSKLWLWNKLLYKVGPQRLFRFFLLTRK